MPGVFARPDQDDWGLTPPTETILYAAVSESFPFVHGVIVFRNPLTRVFIETFRKWNNSFDHKNTKMGMIVSLCRSWRVLTGSMETARSAARLSDANCFPKNNR